MTPRRAAAVRKIKTRYRRFLRSHVSELTTVALLRAFAKALS